MKHALTLFATAALLLAACDKKQDASNAAPAPAPKPTEPAPAPKDPGATVPPPAPVPPPVAAACEELRVWVGKDKLTHTRGDTAELKFADGVDPTALATAFGARAQQCIGALVIAAADEVGYQDIVTVMDKARGAGFTDIALDDADAPAAPRAPSAAAPDLQKAPVVIVTKTELQLGDKKIAFGPELEAELTAALEAATAAGAPAGTFILQADRDTKGKTINAVIRAGHKAGYDNLLFAVKNL